MQPWVAIFAISLVLVVVPAAGIAAGHPSTMAQVSTLLPSPTFTPVGTATRTTTPTASVASLGGQETSLGSPRSGNGAPPNGNAITVRQSNPVTPRGSGDAARALNPPATVLLNPGQQHTYDITFENTGSTTWTTAAGYTMKNVDTGETNLLGNPISTGGCDGLPPGWWCYWAFNLTAGATPGTYVRHYRMYHGDAGFGDTVTFTFIVTAPTSTARPEAIVSGIARFPDTSYTGIDLETNEIRLTNTGSSRTMALVEWLATSFDDIATLVKTDTVDLASGALSILGPDAIPNGCTRCQATISTVDFDGAGSTYGLSTLEAVITDRVTEAGNASASLTAPNPAQLFPQGIDAPNAWELPTVHKRALISGQQWNTLIIACLMRTVQAPRQIELQFSGGGQGPYVVTRATNPGGCITLNLATYDPDDPDYGNQLGLLPNGTYTVRAVALGGFFVSALSYSITGQAATWTNAVTAAPATATPVPAATATRTATPATRFPTPTTDVGFGAARRLEAVVAGISRNPDTSYTGVDIETVDLRVKNLGSSRTVVQVEWYSTSSINIAALVKTDGFEVAAGSDPDPVQSTAIFPRSIIPDGCTRCQAHIYSVDIDGFALLDGVTDLQATITQRIVNAGNATVTAPAPLIEEVIPFGPDVPSAWSLPVVYKRAPVGSDIWNTLITGCMTRGMLAARQVEFQFIAAGQPPVVVTRHTTPGGCITLNLDTFDPKDPDYLDQLAQLPNGAYAVRVTSLGGFYVNALSYSVTGRSAQLTNGVSAPASTPTPTPIGATPVPTATPRTRTPTPTSDVSYATRRLEAVVPGISHNPDTAVPGVDIDTVDLRVTNLGAKRTVAQVEWHSTASDGISALVETNAIELGGSSDPDPIHRTTIFPRFLVPDGCTRCMALVYSVDLDGSGPNIGVEQLQVTTSLRVVNAGNAVASAAVPAFNALFPTGVNTPDTWVFPQVFKNAAAPAPLRNTLLTGCLAPAVTASRSIQFSFVPVGAAGGPYVVTRSLSPRACLALNLNTVAMPDGEYALTITDGGGFVVNAVTYSIPGQTAQLITGALPAVAGHSFALQASPNGSAYASWQTGTAQTGVIIIRWSPVAGIRFFPQNLVPYPAYTTTFADPEVLTEEAYCYLMMAVGGDPPAVGNFLGFSDFACLYPGDQSGNPPVSMTVRLNETDTAVLTWTPPPGGGQPTYRVTAKKFTGAADEIVTLGASAAGLTHNTQGDSTCYTAEALTNGVVSGTARAVCAIPRIAAFPAGGRAGGPAPLERLGRALERPPVR